MTERPPVERLGAYVLGKRLGTGGVSHVWEGTDDAGQTVAIKLLRDPTAGADSADGRRLIREGRLLQRAPHKALPRCLSLSTEPLPHLILEKLPGTTLSRRLRGHGPLSVERVLRLAEDLLEVVSHLHSQGIIHRDIKPGNVFVDEDSGRMWLVDLGLARASFDPGTTTLGDVLGTWATMAPEQLVGAQVDHRCDLYSVGATLYEACANAQPVAADHPADHLDALRDGRRVSVQARVPELPPRLAHTIERLMAWDPVARPQTAAIARALVLGSPRRGAVNRPPMVGRAAARGAVEAALDGRMPVVLLGGPGSGIIRLRSWALQRAMRRGFDTLLVRGRTHGVPGAMMDWLGSGLDRFDGGGGRTPSALCERLSALAAEGPVALIVESADVLPPDAAAALALLATTVPRLALIITAERDPRSLPGHRVSLRPLNVRETALLIGAVLDTGSPPAGLAPALRRVTGGLPGLVTLALRELEAKGALWRSGIDDLGRPRWELDRTATLAPTSGFAQLFGAAIARLSGPARRGLEVVSVSGHPVSVPVLLDVADAGDAASVLGPLLAAGLVSLELHAGVERVHLERQGVALIMLRQLSAERQRELHRRLAAALSRAPDGIWLEPRIRWHRAHGGEGAEAAHELLSLARDLRARGRLNEALELLARLDPDAVRAPLRHALLLCKGRVLAAMSRWTEAARALSEAARGARDPKMADLAALELASVRSALGSPLAAASTLEGVIRRRATHRDDILVLALARAADLHRRAANSEAARRDLDRAGAIASLLDDSDVSTHVAAVRARLLAEAGQLVPAREALIERADQLRHTGRAHLLVPVLQALAVVELRLGRADRALEVLDEAADVCRYAQQPHDRARVAVARTGVFLAVGALESARQALRRARVALDPDAAAELRLAFRDAQLELRLMRDDLAGALAVSQLAEAEAARAGHAAEAAFHLGMVGVLTADATALDEAVDVLSVSDDRRLAARLLLAGARGSDDPVILSVAEAEARGTADRFLLLRALHDLGGAVHREEAQPLVVELASHIPVALQAPFLNSPAVRWAGRPWPRSPTRSVAKAPLRQ